MIQRIVAPRPDDSERRRCVPVLRGAGWRASSRLPRDHYLRLDSNDYSVHPTAVDRRVEIRADLEQVVVTAQGVEVARHQRCWANHQSITDPAHATAAADLRRTRRLTALAPVDTDVEHRRLADYDRMFGLEQPEPAPGEEIA